MDTNAPQLVPPTNTSLAEPFSQIFVDRDEATWAFDLLLDTVKRLGMRGPNDTRFALTLPQQAGKLCLHLNFGPWLVLGFRGPSLTAPRVDMALLADQAAWHERFVTLPSARKEGDPEVRSYHLPLETVRPMTSDLRATYEATLDFIAGRFRAWKRSPYWKQHHPEIVEALFDPDKRAQLFAGLLSETDLRYERHFTAFHQEIGEEEGGYEVNQGNQFVKPLAGDTPMDLGPKVKGFEPNPESIFSIKTFELLTGLHNNPTKNFYSTYKEDFKTYVEEPFQHLFRQVATQLPPSVTNMMETERRIFSRIPKNDYGQGGTWDFYWGAFYPKGSKRTEDAQLSMWINYERLEFGFYIGEYGLTQRQRFSRNCQENYETLSSLLHDLLSNVNLVFGRYDVNSDGSITSKLNISWEDWLKNPEIANFDVSIVLPKTKVLQYSAQKLINLIAETYQQIFPLILLATTDNPLPFISQYLNLPADEIELNPLYPLSTLSSDTGLDEAELARWLRAIERKGQAVLYGPPGTGKTFVAQKLAQHLVGGGDGFVDLVQFHPAYAYEDFIQGLRPQTRPDGGLDYPLVPGRFLDFCRQAALRRDTCVLIIDEINRANLARVFGELMYLLEYRDQEIPLAGGGLLRLPANVRLIATMNTADRSIALVDHALRRRFAFIALTPNFDILRRYHQKTGCPVEKLVDLLTRLNREIADAHYAVGITFFLREDLANQIEDIWRMEIEPYLEEYFFDQPDKVAEFRWEKIKEILSNYSEGML